MIPPLALFAITNIVGIVLAGIFHPGAGIPGLLLIVGLIAHLCITRTNASLRIFSSSVLLLFLGLFLASLASAKLDASLLYRAARESSYVTAEGALIGEPSYRRGLSQFDVKVFKVTIDGKNWRVKEHLRVTVRSDRALPFRAGDYIKASGSLGLPRSTGDFDYRAYLYHRGIAAILSSSTEDIERTTPNSPSLLSFAGSIRGWVKERNSNHLPGDCAGLLNGIVLGDTSMIDEQVDESFKATGLTHIVAASGMNIALILGALWPILRLLRMRATAQFCILVAVSALYTIISGMSPSITRAFIMAGIGLTAWLIGRGKDSLTLLSSAALMILILDPFALYDIGFQLSFLATTALILFAPALERLMSDAPAPLRSGLSVTIAAQIGVLPIMIYYFGYISSISLLANLIVVPLSGPVLILGMAILPIELMSPLLSAPFYLLLKLILEIMISTARLLANAPGSVIYFHQPAIPLVIVVYGILIASMLLVRKLKLRMRFGHVVILLIAVSTLAIFYQVGRAMAPSQLEVVFLDVGQGDAALFTTPDGIRVLVDTGSNPRTLRRALEERGIKKIDAVAVSHAHSDHIGGAPEIFDAFKVGALIYPENIRESQEGMHLLSSARKAGIKNSLIDDGDNLALGKYLRINVLCSDEEAGDTNDQSAVIMAKYGKLTLLFTGDASEKIEEELIDEDVELDADILKVGHHGSATASTREFLKEVTPEVSIISVGKDNMYGHPSHQAINRLVAAGSKIYRTDIHGDVTIRSDGETYSVHVEEGN